MRIRRETATFFYYPDVIVDCTNPSGDRAFLEHPRVLFEILSPATERIDRGEKRVNYQTLSSLDVYALIEQERVAVTLFRRVADGWTTEFLDHPNAVLALPTIECALPLAAIYERTGL